MISKNLVTCQHPRSPVTDAYRMLRTNLYYSNVDDSICTIAITSPNKGEGKTTTGVNLAFTIAKDGHKVLVVDCDLRKPRVHQYFSLENKKGLTNILVEEAALEDTINVLDVEENIHIITSGPLPPNPAEVLGSKKMRCFVSKMQDYYDYIIFDTPPVGQVTDAAIIGVYVDGVLLAIASGQTEMHSAKRALGLLDKVGAKVMGAVLTKATKHNLGYRYSSYYKYYTEGY